MYSAKDSLLILNSRLLFSNLQNHAFYVMEDMSEIICSEFVTSVVPLPRSLYATCRLLPSLRIILMKQLTNRFLELRRYLNLNRHFHKLCEIGRAHVRT